MRVLASMLIVVTAVEIIIGCEACSQNDSHCITCEEETLTCVKCQDGFYLNQTSCEPCGKTCAAEGALPNCNPDSGICRYGCTTDSVWGLRCENDCVGCDYSVCDRTSGCVKGCSNGYFLKATTNNDTGYHCESCPTNCETCYNASSCITCNVGFYGRSCELPCSSRFNHYKCIRCVGDGLDDFNCLECSEEFYPVSGICKPCSIHCREGSGPKCIQSSGVCTHGCKGGWQGTKCDRAMCMVENCNTCDFNNSNICWECNFGFYWDTTAQVCSLCPGACAHLTSCSRSSGECDYGCQDGFSGIRCDEKCNSRCAKCGQNNKDSCYTCHLWFYGTNCEHSCSVNCKEIESEQICDRYTGRCLHGCKSNFSGYNCSISCNEGCKDHLCYNVSGECLNGCEQGYWGATCSMLCNNGCKDKLCDGISGRCVDGCERGHWSETCNATCSFGCRDQACDGASGFCTAGCQGGFKGDTCIEILSVSANQTKGQKGGSDNGRVIGLSVVLSIVGSIAVAAVIAIFLMLRKRRRQNLERSGDMQIQCSQNSIAYNLM